MNRAAWAAIALWTLTIGVFAWFFVRGTTSSGSDDRRVLEISSADRTLILGEMRGLLQATQGIVDGIARDDRAQVARAARSAGMAHAEDADPRLVLKLPLAFKQLGMSVHQGMDDLADAAEQGASTPELLGRLGGELAKCNACHASWQMPGPE